MMGRAPSRSGFFVPDDGWRQSGATRRTTLHSMRCPAVQLKRAQTSTSPSRIMHEHLAKLAASSSLQDHCMAACSFVLRPSPLVFSGPGKAGVRDFQSRQKRSDHCRGQVRVLLCTQAHRAWAGHRDISGLKQTQGQVTISASTASVGLGVPKHSSIGWHICKKRDVAQPDSPFRTARLEAAR